MRKQTLIILTIAMITGMLNCTIVSAMTEQIMKKEKIVEVPDYRPTGRESCSSMQGMVVVGANIFCVKATNENMVTEESKRAATLFKVANFAGNPSIQYKNPIQKEGHISNLKHANGMAFYNNNFYIVTMKPPGTGSQIVAAASSGLVTKQITYNKVISSIAYYGGGKFIVGLPSSSGTRTYAIGKVENNNLVIENDQIFKVRDYSGYAGQDIGFKNGYLYRVTTKIEHNSKGSVVLRKNKILRYNISGDINTSKIYEPDKAYICNAQRADTTLFELESIDFTSNGAMYVNGNMAGQGKSKDAIYRLY